VGTDADTGSSVAFPPAIGFLSTILWNCSGELELHQLLNQFFDRAVDYAIPGYAEAGPITDVNSDIIRGARTGSFDWADVPTEPDIQDLAGLIGLISSALRHSQIVLRCFV
jgi:hypothetical protein